MSKDRILLTMVAVAVLAAASGQRPHRQMIFWPQVNGSNSPARPGKALAPFEK